MASSDMFDDSGTYQQYDASNNKSREITNEELQELQRRARKEGKRDIILSQLVDQQAETAKALKDVNVRLARGDRDIDRIDEDNKRISGDNRRIFDSIGSLVKQNNDTLQLVRDHISQCDIRISRIEKKREEDTKKYVKNTTNTILQTIIANVVSALVIAIVIGGLMSYFLLSGNVPNKP